MRKVILISLLVLFVSPVFAEEPLSFRDIKIGMTMDEVQSKLQWYDCPQGEKYCHSNATIKGVDVNATYNFGGKNTLEMFYFSFSPDDYSILKAALIEKYGKTAKIIKRPVQNRMGASFQGEVVTWTFKSGDSIFITKYGSTLGEGIIMFESKEYKKAQAEKEKKDKQSPGF